MNEKTNRLNGALYGLFIGDALAMPVHWYYDRDMLSDHYGWVTDYLEPRNPHPGSILWRSHYRAKNAKGNILHDQARYWGRPGIHYHQWLRAGENTLNLKICRLLIDVLNQRGTYDPKDFLQRYISFMTTPGTHNDTYVEECHRNFFTNYSNGLPPDRCGKEEKHIGGIGGIIPLVVHYHERPATALNTALAHLSLTHPGPKMADAATLVVDILLDVLNGSSLKRSILDRISSGRWPLLGHPFVKWLAFPDDRIVGPLLSTACYVEDSIPAVIYLALKYHEDPESALISNTNLGGDNAGRGAVLGALLGAANGLDRIPRRWISGLRHPPPDLEKPKRTPLAG